MKKIDESEKERIEEVKLLIRDAFPIDDPEMEEPLSHEDCVDLMISPATIDSNNLKILLRLMFERIIEDYLEEMSLVFVDYLVQYLDQHHYGEKPFMNDEIVKSFYDEKNKRDMDSFSMEQSYAIMKWLEMISTWPQFSRRKEEINDALSYWKMRYLSEA